MGAVEVPPEGWIAAWGARPADRGKSASSLLDWLVPVMPVGSREVADKALDRRQALYLAQAAWWHEVALLLGQSEPASGEKLGQFFAHFTVVFHLACRPAVLGTRGEPAPPLTQEKVVKIVHQVARKYLADLPRHAHRPPATPLPTEAFDGIERLIECLGYVRTDAVLPFQRRFGRDVWTTGAAFKRLLRPERYNTSVDRRARKVLEDSGFPIESFRNPKGQALCAEIFALTPTRGAITLAMKRAEQRYGYRGGRRAFYDAWRKSRS